VQSFGVPFTSLNKLCKHAGQAKTIFHEEWGFRGLSHDMVKPSPHLLVGFLLNNLKKISVS
jgi:hypothetical protein